MENIKKLILYINIMEENICPIKGCANIRQKKGKDKYKMCCRRHTQMKRLLGYNKGEIISKKELHKEFYN